MDALLAVVAFCVNSQCAIFSSTIMFNSHTECAQHVSKMLAELDGHFKQKVEAIAACVKVPIKLI